MRRRPETSFEAFYRIEHGLISLYRYHPEDETHVLHFQTDRLALAYDFNQLRFVMLGPANDVMRETSNMRKDLARLGRQTEADVISVALLPRDLDTYELSLLHENGETYLKTFLRKAGLI